MTDRTTSDSNAMTATVFTVIAAIAFSHFLNDLMQSLLPAIYPMLKDDFGLSFTQVGLLTLTFQFTASLLQPVVGIAADRRPLPYSMAAGMGSTLCGLVLLASAHRFWLLVLAAALVGLGSAISVLIFLSVAVIAFIYIKIFGASAPGSDEERR